ncbi:MAG: EVE domain-containing protein [Gammaproteobacteria bacterium]
MNYWLMKSEPDVFGIGDLAHAPRSRTLWDGVRNYQARNYLRAMRRGDRALFYHSSCAEPGIAGIMRVVSEATPDPTQFDPVDPHYDPKSTREAPRWSVVEVEFDERFTPPVLLQQLREEESLADLVILRRGNRLSVTPITSLQWKYIVKLARAYAQK